MQYQNSLKNVIIVGEPSDLHVRHLADDISRVGEWPVIIDSKFIKEVTWQAGSECEKSLICQRRGIIRGLPQPQCVSLGPAELTAWLDLVQGIISDPTITWLTSLECLRRADNKLYQMNIAHKIGICFPPTIISPHRDIIVEKLGQKVLLKALGSGVVPQVDGEEKVFYSTVIDITSLPDDHFGVAPVIAQQYIKADEHFRIVTVCDDAWSASLEGHSDYLDWREMPMRSRHWTISRLPTEVKRNAIALARATQVGFSSQDWLRAGKQYYFLDLNPSGRWLFLPKSLAEAITEGIIRWLTLGSYVGKR